jgi:hypothetical protein
VNASAIALPSFTVDGTENTAVGATLVIKIVAVLVAQAPWLSHIWSMTVRVAGPSIVTAENVTV